MKTYQFHRHKSQKKVNIQYLDNCRIMNEYFNIWFAYSDPTTYKDMLKECHIIMTKNYYGNTNTDKPANYLRGILRNETDNIVLNTPKLKKEWYRKELTNITKNKIIPNITRIPEEALPILKKKGKYLYLYLPNKKYVSLYLREMEIIMNRLKDSFKHAQDEDMLINQLSKYLQLGVICHPFEKVNFSLLMNQVNTVLILYGFNPIPHSYLDFKCFICSSDEFEYVFQKEFKKENK